MQMKPLLAVLLPVKGSYVGYGTAGRRSVRGNSKSALVGTVCAVLPPCLRIPVFISVPFVPFVHKRAYNVQWIRKRNAGSFREHGAHFIPASCRVAIKLRGAINHLRQCEETDFADEWTRTTRPLYASRLFGIRFRAKCLLKSKLAIDRKPSHTSFVQPKCAPRVAQVESSL